MRILALSVLLAGSVVAAPASAQSFVGEWRATAEVPDGTFISETIRVEKAGDGYAITARDLDPPSADGTSAGPGVDIVIEGDTFSYKRIARTPQGDIEIIYKGTVDGDSFTGTGEIGGFSVPYNGERIGSAE
jgi:hypothetical protein